MDLFRESLKRSVPHWESCTFVLAVSGGVDSMVLWELFREILPSSQVVIASFDHRTRKESAAEVIGVGERATNLGHSFFSGVRKGTKVSESALREERHAFLESIREKVGADFIVTAHHLGDQLETFFMRLLRGTGVHGLSGMKARNGRKLKPLLEVSKREIIQYAKLRGISWQEDASNGSMRYFRNRIRHQVLPSFLKMSEEFGGEEAFERKFRDLIKDLGESELPLPLETHPFWIRISGSSFNDLEPTEKRKWVRQVASRLVGAMPTREQTNLALDYMKEKRKKFSWWQGMEGSYSCGFYYFQSEEQRRALLAFQPVVPGELPLELKNLELRLFRPGDRFGKSKLKTHFLKKRIGRLQRSVILVAARRDTSEVLALHGENGWETPT